MPLRVLIVEDEPLIALHIQNIVEDADHEVVGIVPDMQGALRIAASHPIDVATVDVVLSRQPDGVETARRLETEYGVRSVFVSSVIARAREGSIELDPVGFVDKPFREGEILQALRSVESASAS